jgi:hypothetical protein
MSVTENEETFKENKRDDIFEDDEPKRDNDLMTLMDADLSDSLLDEPAKKFSYQAFEKILFELSRDSMAMKLIIDKYHTVLGCRNSYDVLPNMLLIKPITKDNITKRQFIEILNEAKRTDLINLLLTTPVASEVIFTEGRYEHKKVSEMEIWKKAKMQMICRPYYPSLAKILGLNTIENMLLLSNSGEPILLLIKLWVFFVFYLFQLNDYRKKEHQKPQ